MKQEQRDKLLKEIGDLATLGSWDIELLHYGAISLTRNGDPASYMATPFWDGEDKLTISKSLDGDETVLAEFDFNPQTIFRGVELWKSYITSICVWLSARISGDSRAGSTKGVHFHLTAVRRTKDVTKDLHVIPAQGFAVEED